MWYVSHVGEGRMAGKGNNREICEWVDLCPDKELNPVGFLSKEWFEPTNSTELPHWNYWKVIGESKTFRYQVGEIVYFERFASIEGITEEEFSGGKDKRKIQTRHKGPNGL